MVAHPRFVHGLRRLAFSILLSLPPAGSEARQEGILYCSTAPRLPPRTVPLTTQQSIACQLARLKEGEIRGLDLSRRKVSEAEMTDLVQRLQLIPPKTPPSLSLVFTSAELDSAAARTLAYSLPHLTALVGLVLAKATVAPDGIAALIKALPACKNLQYLNLASLPLTPRDGCLLTDCPALKTLDLKDCGVTDAGVEKLASSLPFLPMLSFLDLSGNPIGDTGATALIEALTSLKQTSLRMLYLVNTPDISLPLKKELVTACNSKEITLFFGGDDVRDPLTQKHLREAAIYWKGRCTPANVQIDPVLFIF